MHVTKVVKKKVQNSFWRSRVKREDVEIVGYGSVLEKRSENAFAGVKIICI